VRRRCTWSAVRPTTPAPARPGLPTPDRPAAASRCSSACTASTGPAGRSARRCGRSPGPSRSPPAGGRDRRGGDAVLRGRAARSSHAGRLARNSCTTPAHHRRVRADRGRPPRHAGGRGQRIHGIVSPPVRSVAARGARRPRRTRDGKPSPRRVPSTTPRAAYDHCASHKSAARTPGPWQGTSSRTTHSDVRPGSDRILAAREAHRAALPYQDVDLPVERVRHELHGS
jgi:hypothetical protein